MPALGEFLDDYQTPVRALPPTPAPVAKPAPASTTPPTTAVARTSAQPTAANTSRALQLSNPAAAVHPGTAAKAVAPTGGYWWHQTAPPPSQINKVNTKPRATSERPLERTNAKQTATPANKVAEPIKGYEPGNTHPASALPKPVRLGPGRTPLPANKGRRRGDEPVPARDKPKSVALIRPADARPENQIEDISERANEEAKSANPVALQQLHDGAHRTRAKDLMSKAPVVGDSDSVRPAEREVEALVRTISKITRDLQGRPSEKPPFSRKAELRYLRKYHGPTTPGQLFSTRGYNPKYEVERANPITKSVENIAHSAVELFTGRFDSAWQNLTKNPNVLEDCTNFVSQALRAGGWSEDATWNYTRPHQLPAWRGSGGRVGGASPAWDRVDAFVSYALRSGRATVVPLIDALPGDIIVIANSGSGAPGTSSFRGNHAMIVSNGTGLNIEVAAHGDNRYDYPFYGVHNSNSIEGRAPRHSKFFALRVVG
jgi:hypothetical protein